MKKIALKFLGSSFLAILVFITCHSFLLTAYAGFFTVNNATSGADALVVLGGNMPPRIWEAIDLYRKGYAPQIVLTNPGVSKLQLKNILCTEEDDARAILSFSKTDALLAIAPSLKGGATSTFDEAHDLRAYCAQHQYRHIIIVTDSHHTRRSLYAFKKIFSGTGILVEAAAAPNDIFSEASWWKTDRGIESYVIEPVKFIVYLFSTANAAFIENV